MATQRTSPWKITRAKASAVSSPTAASLTRNLPCQMLPARSSTNSNLLHSKQPGALDVPVPVIWATMVSSSKSLDTHQDRRVFRMFTTNGLQTFSLALISQTRAALHATQQSRPTTLNSTETVSMALISQTLAVRRRRRAHRMLPPNGVKLLPTTTTRQTITARQGRRRRTLVLVPRGVRTASMQCPYNPEKISIIYK